MANLKALCEPLTETCSVERVPTVVDTDTLSVGGHGTHVSGIVAGRPTTLTDGGVSRAPHRRQARLDLHRGRHRHPGR